MTMLRSLSLSLLFVCAATMALLLVRLLALLISLFGLQFLHVLLEIVEALLPELAIVAEPLRCTRERLRFEAARAKLRVAAARDEACALEHLEVLRDGGLAHVERLHEVRHRRFALSETRQDRAPRGVGKRSERQVERVIHSLEVI